MTYPEVKLVDAPSTSANVLFDFNDTTLAARREVLADGFTIGIPELVGDVDAVDPLWGPRTVKFDWRVTGTKANSLAAQSALARVLLTRTIVYLSVKLHSTATVKYLRAYRPTPGELSFEDVLSTSTTKSESWTLEVTIPCEGLGYGEQVNQTAQTLNNDPVSGTNPMRIVLPAISGDAPTRLRFITSHSGDQTGYRHLCSLLSTPGAAQTPTLMQIGTGDSFTPQTDTGAGAADATFSGGSYRATTFATDATMVSRLIATTPALTPGAYRVLVRIGRTNATTQFSMAASLGGDIFTPTIVTNLGPTGAATSRTWVDLGQLTFPVGGDPDATAAVTGSLVLKAGRPVGSSDLRWDAVLLVPEHDTLDRSSQTLITAFTGIAGSTGTVVTRDGDKEACWSAGSFSRAELSGTFLTAIPGNAHVLTLLTDVDPVRSGSTPNDSITTSTSVSVSYYPRWLWLGDS